MRPGRRIPFTQEFMMRYERIGVLFLAVCLGLVAFASSALAAGGQISAQELVENLKKEQGKVIVLNFWASWCQPCQLEIPELIGMRKNLSDDVYMIGVSVDQDPDQYKGFAENAGFNYPVFNGGQDVAILFGVSAIPKTMVFNKNGELSFSSNGYVPAEDLRKVVEDLQKG